MMAVGMMEKNMTDNCIEWTKSKDRDGYGLHWNGTKMVRAHRVAYEEYYGSFDSELSVCHICDNPSCVNPKHLFLGTQQDNMNDRKQKNRYIWTVGHYDRKTNPRGYGSCWPGFKSF